MDRTSQISWTTCSSAGSVSSTQCAPLPRSTPAPLAYRASTINVGSPRTRPHLHHHPSHRSGARGPDLSEPHLIHTLPLGDCGGRTSSRWAKGEWRGTCDVRASAPGGHRLRCGAGDRCRRRRGLRRHRQRLQVPRGRAQRRRRSGSSTARRAGPAGSTSRSTSSTASCPARTARPGSTSSRTARRSSPSTSNASRGQAIETSRLESQDGGSAAIPAAGDVRMAGGTLASADAETGEVWAVRYDAELGKPVMSAVDRQSEAIAEAGEGAALAVSQRGTIVVTSTDDGTVTTLEPSGAAFGKPATEDLPGDAGQVTSVTTVGERIVTLDADAGVLRVVDGATASVPAGSVLQQAGPDYDAVLVGAPEALLSVDLDSGDVTTVSSKSGTPVEPVRLGAVRLRRLVRRRRARWPCSAGRRTSWRTTSAATPPASPSGSTAARSSSTTPTAAPSGTSSRTSPIRIDNWDAFTSKKKNKDDENENENQSDADRRPPQAKPDSYGVRAGRTTVLHPLDNDSAPDGRLLSIVDVDQPSGGARVEISPDGQTLILQMPEQGPCRRRSTTSSTTAATGSRPTRRSTSTCAAARRTSRRSCARATRSRPTGCRTAARSPCRCSRTGATTATATPCSSTRRRPWAATRPAPWPAPRPTAGSASAPRPRGPTASSWCASSSP